MLEYFPIFSYIKWREHSRKMLTDKREVEAGRLNPLHWLEEVADKPEAVSGCKVSGGGHGGAAIGCRA